MQPVGYTLLASSARRPCHVPREQPRAMSLETVQRGQYQRLGRERGRARAREMALTLRKLTPSVPGVSTRQQAR